MALKGTLGDINLVDIIQLIDLGRKTGAVVIHGRRGDETLNGRLYFAEGKICAAELGEIRGEEAAFSLFTATEGPFELVEGVPLPPRNVHVSNEVVIMEGIMRQDVSAMIQRWIKSGDMLIKLVPNPRSTSREIAFEADKWRILTLINGKTTVDQIVQRSGLGRFRAYQILAELMEAGLAEGRIELRPQSAIYPRLEQIAVAGLGKSAPMLLQDAFQRVGLDPSDPNASPRTILQALRLFEQAAGLLLGLPRSKELTDQLRAMVPA